MIEQTRFLSIVFLGREFKLENSYSELNFCRKKVCGNFYLRELILADHWKKTAKIAKIRTRKNFVPHGNQKGLMGWTSRQSEFVCEMTNHFGTGRS